MPKKVYEAPALRAHGKVESLTKATMEGLCFDGNFNFGDPAQAPFGDCS